MRFLIFGAGALGQALGCMLAVAGHKVDLVLRRRFVNVLKDEGLRVSGIFGDYAARPAMLGFVEDISGLAGGYDFVLITTKAYDTDGAVAAIVSVPDCRCPVVSMQNGCGNVEQIVRAFGPERSLGARVITGFEISSPGHIRITVSADAVHLGAAVAGPIPTAAEILAAAIDRSGLPCVAVADIHQDLYAKLLYNCALNPLGAILGVHYGALAESEETRPIMDKVIEETFAVVQALGGKTPWPDASSYKKLFYERLVPITYDHRPSMLQDLENGKPTEVEALVGYVSTKGRSTGVPTPTCDILAGLVRFRETAVRKKGYWSSS
jgi:2-dehydropantoate 2-reductase